jgi:hypothetical protein
MILAEKSQEKREMILAEKSQRREKWDRNWTAIYSYPMW